ncbi:MAG TPA: holo-ACP synthase [Pyrinomonadaceae bacterium]|nr:holo-ACP synthase [Pyrinomonadaceae bacterium]
MIISVGIDIIEVSRVRRTLERTPRFLERVFTANERAYCDSRGSAAAQHYAARFAAKEAAMKALGTGWSGGVAWADVEVVSNEAGAPALVLKGRALEVFRERGATSAHLSLSHTSEHAVAQVILERL